MEKKFISKKDEFAHIISVLQTAAIIFIYIRHFSEWSEANASADDIIISWELFLVHLIMFSI
jgi:hypothetical protein